MFQKQSLRFVAYVTAVFIVSLLLLGKASFALPNTYVAFNNLDAIDPAHPNTSILAPGLTYLVEGKPATFSGMNIKCTAIPSGILGQVTKYEEIVYITNIALKYDASREGWVPQDNLFTVRTHVKIWYAPGSPRGEFHEYDDRATVTRFDILPGNPGFYILTMDLNIPSWKVNPYSRFYVTGQKTAIPKPSPIGSPAPINLE